LTSMREIWHTFDARELTRNSEKVEFKPDWCILPFAHCCGLGWMELNQTWLIIEEGYYAHFPEIHRKSESQHYCPKGFSIGQNLQLIAHGNAERTTSRGNFHCPHSSGFGVSPKMTASRALTLAETLWPCPMKSYWPQRTNRDVWNVHRKLTRPVNTLLWATSQFPSKKPPTRR
jgi:hypothetical protein